MFPSHNNAMFHLIKNKFKFEIKTNNTQDLYSLKFDISGKKNLKSRQINRISNNSRSMWFEDPD